MKKPSKLVNTILFFIIANVILVGGQKLWHLNDQKRLDEIKTDLEAQLPKIKSLEKELETLEISLDQMESRMNQLDVEIRTIESANPQGIPQAIYFSYSQKVDEYNSLIKQYNTSLTRFKNLYPDYSARVDSYNALVDEANSLAREIGGTWIIIPQISAFTR